MSSERKSSIMDRVKSGAYIKQFKFVNYGSVVEDSIKAQQRQADRRLKEIQAQRLVRQAKGVA
jgi:hypothetical protein